MDTNFKLEDKIVFIFELRKKRGLWYWYLKNTRGRGCVLAQSGQGHKDRSNAQRSAKQVKDVLSKLKKIPFVSTKED